MFEYILIWDWLKIWKNFKDLGWKFGQYINFNKLNETSDHSKSTKGWQIRQILWVAIEGIIMFMNLSLSLSLSFWRGWPAGVIDMKKLQINIYSTVSKFYSTQHIFQIFHLYGIISLWKNLYDIIKLTWHYLIRKVTPILGDT